MARAKAVMDGLREAITSPETELNYENEFQLLVAVMLSAQCTDERVNLVTPKLFEAYPTPQSLYGVKPEEVFPLIRSISYPNNKSKHLVGMAYRLIEDFGGNVPGTIDDLVKLPGVGRKTAQVVASVAFDVAAIPVDTHVFRVANRLGIAKNASTPLAVEKQLKRVLPKEDWSEAHHLLILHGRYTCRARDPECKSCPISAHCAWFESLEKLPADRTNLEPKRGRHFCGTCKRYFDEASSREDRHGTNQISCPTCKSMNVFISRTGRTTKRIKDYRV